MKSVMAIVVCVCAVNTANMAAAIVQTMWAPAAGLLGKAIFGTFSIAVIVQTVFTFELFLAAITFNMAGGGK